MRHAEWMENDERNKRVYQMMFGSIAIYTNPDLEPGVIELRNRNGEVVGRLEGIKQIDVR